MTKSSSFLVFMPDNRFSDIAAFSLVSCPAYSQRDPYRSPFIKTSQHTDYASDVEDSGEIGRNTRTEVSWTINRKS